MIGYLYGSQGRGIVAILYNDNVNLSPIPVGNRHLSVDQDLGIKVATPIGTLIGQLFFGWLADLVGRKRMCECYFFACRMPT